MKKADKILIVCIMILSAVLLYFISLHKPHSEFAVVKVKNKEVMRLDLNKEQTVLVKGTMGDVIIDVKNHQVAVVQENSPYHVCSIQGYVSNPDTPLICLPNDVVVEIEGSDGSEDTLIQ